MLNKKSFLLILLFTLPLGTSCSRNEDDTPFHKLLKMRLDVNAKEQKYNGSKKLAGEVHREMQKHLSEELDAIGTAEERLAILKEIEKTKVKIPSYLYKKAVVNQYLFDHYFMQTVAFFDVNDLLNYKESNVKEDKNSEKVDDGKVDLKALHKYMLSRGSDFYLPPRMIVDSFFLTAPGSVSTDELKEIAEKVREKIESPVNEMAIFDAEKVFKELNKKSEIRGEVRRGDKLLRHGVFATAEGFHLPPDVAEPPKTLVGKDGNLSHVTRDEVVSPIFVLEIPKGKKGIHRQVGFYIKLIDLPERRVPREKLAKDAIFSWIFLTAKNSQQAEMNQLLRDGDWSFYSENLQDKQ